MQYISDSGEQWEKGKYFVLISMDHSMDMLSVHPVKSLMLV